MEYVIPVIALSAFTYVVLRYTVFMPPKYERVYTYLDSYMEAVEEDDLFYSNAAKSLMFTFELTYAEADLCVVNYRKGLDWFKAQEFLQD